VVSKNEGSGWEGDNGGIDIMGSSRDSCGDGAAVFGLVGCYSKLHVIKLYRNLHTT
jgi:hypothetical protein